MTGKFEIPSRIEERIQEFLEDRNTGIIPSTESAAKLARIVVFNMLRIGMVNCEVYKCNRDRGGISVEGQYDESLDIIVEVFCPSNGKGTFVYNDCSPIVVDFIDELLKQPE